MFFLLSALKHPLAPDFRPPSPGGLLAGAGSASNARTASHAVPAAVLSSGTRDPAVRILPLTSGAKGSRTLDPLLANNRPTVHQRASVQVTVQGRSSPSASVRIGCGTSVLYCPASRVGTMAQGASGRRAAQHPDGAPGPIRGGRSPVAGEQFAPKCLGERNIGRIANGWLIALIRFTILTIVRRSIINL